MLPNLWEGKYPIWEKYYPKNINCVLDIGCEIESYNWFLSHGVKEVIGIGEEWNGKHIDAIKIDIEGAEKNTIIETHFENPKLELLHTWSNGVQLWKLIGGKSLW